jgi:hypothetical protein
MNELEKLSPEEKELLFKAPAYISILAANADGEMDKIEKKVAVELTHIKSFSCPPLLVDFYQEVEKSFSGQLQKLDNYLPKGKQERAEAIKKELNKIEVILTKLGNRYAETLHRSLNTYSEHVSKAHNNLLTTFLFPLDFKGLPD